MNNKILLIKEIKRLISIKENEIKRLKKKLKGLLK